MAVGVVVQTELEAKALVGWGWSLGRARKSEVKVFFAGGRDADDQDPPYTAAQKSISDCVAAHTRLSVVQSEQDDRQAEDIEPCPAFDLIILKSANPSAAVLEAISEHDIKLLVIAKHERAKGDENGLPQVLFREAPCAVLLLRPTLEHETSFERILVPTSGGPHATEALKLADQLAGLPRLSCDLGDGHALPTGESAIDALYVEPDIGPEAMHVGQRILSRAIRKSVGDPDKHPHIHPLVEIGSDFRGGIASVCERSSYGLVLIGATNQWHARKALFGSVPDKLLQPNGESGRPPLTIGVMRQAVPLFESATQAVRDILKRVVPQLEREDRITLVERVQGASEWNFDFIALICLSTLIATLGLMQNSVAVVVGAMLVAPLMTPLIGCGLAVVQGNGRLIRGAVKAVILGFLLAFSIAVLMGLLVPYGEMTSQMLARGKPNTLDLGVAFVSGLAAAYATARPNLSAALPGVAIAAALVPPIATSGVALSHGDVVVSAGAALLFVTNIVAIVLGAAISLYAVGMQAASLNSKKKRWTRSLTMGLVVSSVLLFVPLSYVLYGSLPHDVVPTSLREKIEKRIASNPGASMVEIAPPVRQSGNLLIEITQQAPAPASDELVRDLDALFETHFEKPCTLRIVTHLVSESDRDE